MRRFPLFLTPSSDCLIALPILYPPGSLPLEHSISLGFWNRTTNFSPLYKIQERDSRADCDRPTKRLGRKIKGLDVFVYIFLHDSPILFYSIACPGYFARGFFWLLRVKVSVGVCDFFSANMQMDGRGACICLGWVGALCVFFWLVWRDGINQWASLAALLL